MVMEMVHEDMGDGSMQCTNHPFKNSAPGGICAICLQEKLGKLVSSSFPITVFPSSSSSSSPSFRSDFDNSSSASTAGAAAGGVSTSRHLPSSSSQINGSNNEVCYYPRRSSRLPFVLTHRKLKKNYTNNNGVLIANVSSENTSIVFKRSKSTVTPRRRGMHFLDESFDSPYKKGFWSFFYTSKHKKSDKSFKDLSFNPATATPSSSTMGVSSSVSGVAGPSKSRDKKTEDNQIDENVSPNEVGLDRKVSRSRSVGCGSRSFSGDFFERISTGFGDCTLRRVESQREGKSKVQSSMQRNGGQDYIKDRVRCGGIFSGFMITSSSSSSSSMVSEDNNNNNINGKPISVNNNNINNNSSSAVRNLSHGRSKSWGWALASPMRAFSKPSSNSAGKRAKQGTANLAAIPSLLAVSS
ncbi:hypothetical protein CASFOL_030084 [Castilleja foliolosa]|uniref:Vitellogenin-like protein n=1 Tax=Castilleja foliolosa TaxID=1961234 RepID=A0ABD3C9M8_9LAMI